MSDPDVQIMNTIRTELAQGIIQPEAIRAFIHPVVVPTIYRSPDELAEIAEIRRMRQADTK